MSDQTKFEDAATWAALHPSTFQVPSNTELVKIKPGTLVKVCANNERFWVNITSIDGNIITGTIDNDLVQDGLKYGDIVTFKPNHIYQIYQEK